MNSQSILFLSLLSVIRAADILDITGGSRCADTINFMEELMAFKKKLVPFPSGFSINFRPYAVRKLLENGTVAYVGAFSVSWRIYELLARFRNPSAFPEPWRDSDSFAQFQRLGAILEPWRIFGALTHFWITSAFSEPWRDSRLFAHLGIIAAFPESWPNPRSLTHF